MKKKFKNIINEDSMKLFWMLCGYFLLVLVLYTICNLLRFRNCLGIIQVLSVSIPIVFYCFSLEKKKNIKKTAFTLCIYLFILLMFPFIYTKTFDLSCDGNSYHKSAIGFIKNGWNPLFETVREFQEKNDRVFKIADDERLDIWMEHYPKATWIISAVMYDMTNNIESGKCLNIIFSIMLLIISYNCLKIILSRKFALLSALLFVFNPVSLAQIFSYYVDGLMGVLFAIEFFLLLMIDFESKQNNFIWMALASICTVFVNLKFSGLLASGVIAAVFYFYWFFKYKKGKDFWIKFKKVTINFIIVFSTAIFLVGASSYVKNTFEHKNPLYPIIGKDKIDIITTMQPKSFKDKNGFEKFVISIVSRTENVIYGVKEPTLKLPFKLYKSEIDEVGTEDTRIGGFGPFFALLLIVSIPILILNIIIFIKNEKENIFYIVLPVITIVISMILLGEAWWARYVPQFYFIVVLTFILTLYNYKHYSKKYIPIFSVLLILGVISMNSVVFLYKDFRKFMNFRNINYSIEELRNIDNLELRATTKDLRGSYYVLYDKGINFTIVEDDIPEEDRVYVYMYTIKKKGE